MSWSDDLRLAHTLADQADGISMARFRADDLRVDAKPDMTPVSDADLAVEDAIRKTLQRARPRDAVHGEERADTGTSNRRWVIDPIDGTKNFVRGVPVWATLIALMEDDEVVVGVVSAPALHRRWWAVKDRGAYTGRSLVHATRCQVSAVREISDASLSYSSLDGWIASEYGQQFVDLLRDCWRTRAYGDFWSYMLVAEGAVDLAGEPELNLYDMAACAVVVTEAGGRFTNVAGEPGTAGPGALASNGVLHDVVLQRMNTPTDQAEDTARIW